MSHLRCDSLSVTLDEAACSRKWREFNMRVAGPRRGRKNIVVMRDGGGAPEHVCTACTGCPIGAAHHAAKGRPVPLTIAYQAPPVPRGQPAGENVCRQTRGGLVGGRDVL